MKARISVAELNLDVDLARPFDLSRAVRFEAPGVAATQPFDAPPPLAEALRVGAFTGEVAHGGSCNCRTITFTPHASGTHTECVAHLTRETLDAWTVVPVALLPAILLQVTPARRADGDALITEELLAAAWPRATPFAPIAAIIGSGFAGSARDLANPAYLAGEAAALLVRRGIEHVVTDLPSLDRRDDGGALAAHRVFFGLPPRSVTLGAAGRPRATITELAAIPASLAPGAYLLALEVPAIAGDAVASRPLLYRLEGAGVLGP